MEHTPSLSEKLTGEYLPFIIMGIGVGMLAWVYVIGDLVMG